MCIPNNDPKRTGGLATALTRGLSPGVFAADGEEEFVARTSGHIMRVNDSADCQAGNPYVLLYVDAPTFRRNIHIHL